MKTRFIFLSLIAALLGLGLWANVVVGQPLSAQEAHLPSTCNVSGIISSNTTWSPTTCDPYIVTGNIIVQNGITLTIEAGTTIKFDSLKAMAVQGKLVSIGTAANPITFTSNAATPAKGDWGYLFLGDSSPDDPQCDGSGSILQYTTIEYAGGSETSNNGALRIEASSPCIEHNTIQHNQADGIYVWNNSEGELRISNNNISDNGIADSAEASGIYIVSSNTVTITDNTISDNTYAGIYVSSSNTLTITDNTISDNTYIGISQWSANATTTISNNVVTGNGSVDQSGGGIQVVYVSDTNITNNTITDNSGYGISVYSTDTVTISDNTISDNKSGINVQNSDNTTTIISNNVVTGNGSVDQGGAGISVHSNNCDNTTIISNIITGNSGGILINYCDNGTITNNTITDNSTNQGGGGIYVYRSDTNITNNTITNNSASFAGGGIYLDSNGTLSNNIIAGNIVTEPDGQGGGIYLSENSEVTINDNDICGNIDAFDGDLYNGNGTSNALDAQNNYWGETELSSIEEHVWHFLDDASLGFVDYDPFYTTPVFGDPQVCTPPNTPTPTPTSTPSPSATPTNTNTPSPSPTPSNTATNTQTPGPSPTPTNTPTATNTLTPGPSPTPSNTPTATNTQTPSPTPTPSNTPTATNTLTPGPSPTPSNTPTPINTHTPSPSPTPSNTSTATNTHTPGPSPTPSNTPTATNTLTPGPSPTATESVTPSPTFTPSATASATNTPNPNETLLAIYALAFDNNPLSPANLTPLYSDAIKGIIDGTVGQPEKTAVVLADLDGVGDTHILVIQDGQATPIMGLPDTSGILSTTLDEYNMTDGATLGGFLKWARQTYPADKTTFNYTGHGTALTPETDFAALFGNRMWSVIPLPFRLDLNPDTTDHHPQLSLISPYDLAQALDIATNGGQDKFDVLDIYHCFAASIEEFYEVADYAETIVGAPNYAFFDPFMLGQALSAIQTSMSAPEMATTFVESYHDAIPTTEHPHIIVAVESSKLEPIKEAVDTMSYYLMQQMNSSLSATKANISAAYTASAKYDTTFCEPQDWDLAPPDALSDLGDFADQLSQQFGPLSGVGIWATNVKLRTSGAIIARRFQNGSPWVATASSPPIWDFTDNSGLALYTDFAGITFPNDSNLYLSWQAAFYNNNNTNSTNPQPYQFIQDGFNSTTWEDVFNKFWDGINVETALCLPVLPAVQQPGEVSADYMLFPITGSVSEGSPVLPSVVMSTEHEIRSALVKFEIVQNNTVVYSNTVSTGARVTGTYQIDASTHFTPTATGFFTLTATVDADDRIVESNENNNIATHNDVVLPAPPQPRPVINAQVVNNRQWISTTTVSLDISQAAHTSPPPVSLLVVQSYQYTPGVNPNTQVPTLLAQNTFNNISLPQSNFALTLPSTTEPGPVILHIWGWSTGGLSVSPAIVHFNYIPANTSISQGSQHYYLFNANTSDALDFTLNASSGDPNLFLWMPNHYRLPTWHSTLIGSDSLQITAPTTGEYVLSIYGESAATYTLNPMRNGIPNARQREMLGDDNPNAYIPQSRPTFIEPIPEVPDISQIGQTNFQLYLPAIRK